MDSTGISNGARLDFQWKANGFQMDSPCISNGFQMDAKWICHQHLQWISNGFRMDSIDLEFIWMSNGLQIVSNPWANPLAIHWK